MPIATRARGRRWASVLAAGGVIALASPAPGTNSSRTCSISNPHPIITTASDVGQNPEPLGVLGSVLSRDKTQNPWGFWILSCPGTKPRTLGVLGSVPKGRASRWRGRRRLSHGSTGGPSASGSTWPRSRRASSAPPPAGEPRAADGGGGPARSTCLGRGSRSTSTSNDARSSRIAMPESRSVGMGRIARRRSATTGRHRVRTDRPRVSHSDDLSHPRRAQRSALPLTRGQP